MSNVALKQFKSSTSGEESASFAGVQAKTGILLGLLVLSAFLSMGMSLSSVAFIGILIVSTIVGFVIIFKQSLAPILAPVYALGEGVIIGVLSALMEQKYPGIVSSAVAGTVGLFGTILLLYKLKIIKNSPMLTKGILFAMLGILIVRIVDLFMGGSFIPKDGMMGIGIQVMIVAVATFSFIIDFEAIELAVEHKASKKDEWYLAFGLIVSIVWLYLEVLRLLSKKK